MINSHLLSLLIEMILRSLEILLTGIRLENYIDVDILFTDLDL